MSKNDKHRALVPRLRFPEFRDAGGWEEKTIETLARVTQGGTPDTSNGEYWDGTINWMTPAEMGKGDSPYISSTMRTLTEEGLNNCSSELLPAYSVIVSTRAPIGHIAINTVPIAINQGCRGLVPVEDAHFLYYVLLRAKPRLMDFGAGNTFKELSGSALKRFVLQTPSLSEQQKIADCLSSLDELIVAEGRKLAALQDHKKGLMQQLFPREGETRPRLRFPEFRDAGEWREKHLASVFKKITNGKENAQDHVEGGRYPLFDRSAIIKRSDNFIFDAEAVIIPGEGMQFQPRYFKGKFNLHQRAYALLDCKEDSEFIFYALDQSKERLARKAVQSTVLSLRLPILEKFTIKCPCLAEQQKIADSLSTLDALITAQAEKLDALRTHKRGLMQQLFPAPEEVGA